MSRDQKPGKVRVIGERDAGAAPNRRAADRDPLARAGTAADRAAVADPAEAAPNTGGLALVPVVLFLMCCASGGIAFTLLVLPALPQ
jgi:hypothetical protein